MRQVDHPCKLERIGRSNSYRVLHCEHIVLRIPSYPQEYIAKCCHCTFQAPFKQGDALYVGKAPHGRYPTLSRPDDKSPQTNADESEHERLVSGAKKAIQAIAVDFNVTLEYSIESLKALRNFIDTRLDILERGI